MLSRENMGAKHVPRCSTGMLMGVGHSGCLEGDIVIELKEHLHGYRGLGVNFDLRTYLWE